MNSKIITPKDFLTVKDRVSQKLRNKSPFRTEISAYDEFGDILFTLEHNMVVIGGAITVLEKMWNIRSSLMIDTINNINQISPAVQSTTEKLPQNDYVCMWGIGIGGSGDAFGSVRDVKYYEREIGQNGQSNEFIPFRTVTTALEGEDLQKYTLSKSVGSGFTAYYAKLFDSEPFIRSLWRDGQDGKDGTEVTDGVHNTQRTEEIETFVEMHMQLNENDVREWFEMNGNIEQARVNTIGLFTGRLTSDGHGGYTASNVKLFTKFNFDNEALGAGSGSSGGSTGGVSSGKTISFIYRIYAS